MHLWKVELGSETTTSYSSRLLVNGLEKSGLTNSYAALAYACGVTQTCKTDTTNLSKKSYLNRAVLVAWNVQERFPPA